jgi:DNA repair ATPase RecN
MSAVSIQEKFTEYLNINKELAGFRKLMKQHKQRIDTLEKEIKEYMTQHDMDSVSLKDGEIVLYARKISQTFKKETIVEKLTEQLKDSQKAEELTQSIISNKKFVVEDKIKAVMKKSLD